MSWSSHSEGKKQSAFSFPVYFMGTVITEGAGGGKPGTETVRRPNDVRVQTQKKKLTGV